MLIILSIISVRVQTWNDHSMLDDAQNLYIYIFE